MILLTKIPTNKIYSFYVKITNHHEMFCTNFMNTYNTDLGVVNYYILLKLERIYFIIKTEYIIEYLIMTFEKKIQPIKETQIKTD